MGRLANANAGKIFAEGYIQWLQMQYEKLFFLHPVNGTHFGDLNLIHRWWFGGNANSLQ